MFYLNAEREMNVIYEWKALTKLPYVSSNDLFLVTTPISELNFVFTEFHIVNARNQYHARNIAEECLDITERWEFSEYTERTGKPDATDFPDLYGRGRACVSLNRNELSNNIKPSATVKYDFIVDL